MNYNNYERYWVFLSIQQNLNYYGKSDVYKYIQIKEKYVYTYIQKITQAMIIEIDYC